MSINTKVFSCFGHPVDWLTLLKMCIVKDADGNHYLNLFYDDCDDCETLDPAVLCASHMTIEEIFKNIVVEDECGNPAIALTGNICVSCE